MPSPIAFIIPALNEEAALAPMLDGLRAALDAACVDADLRNFAQDGAGRVEDFMDYREIWIVIPSIG